MKRRFPDVQTFAREFEQALAPDGADDQEGGLLKRMKKLFGG